MTTHPAVHCPECGAITRRETQDDGDMVLVCTDEDCARIIVGVLSRARRHDQHCPANQGGSCLGQPTCDAVSA